ncbi:MAG: hypothetical protein HQL97_04640 [Magnetococcales bacterium]|nr:hypothetical protein [Magnetococcales bacterium]
MQFLRTQSPTLNQEPPDRSACRTDGLELLAIADAIAAAKSAWGEELAPWRRTITDLLKDPDLESLRGELQLEALSLALRGQWVRMARSVVDPFLKSPIRNQPVSLPISSSSGFVYERVFNAGYIEKKIASCYTPIPTWTTRHAAFGSGMAAITALILTLGYYRKVYQRADGHTLRLDWLGGYYEMQRLIALLDNPGIYARRIPAFESLLERVRSGKTDILFVEPVLYDWSQTVADPHALIEAIQARPADRPWILMTDSTLLGATFDLGEFLRACGDRWPLLAVDLRSGLKLDQHGLEFANLGMVGISTHPDLDERYPSAERFKKRLTLNRSVLGSGLSVEAAATLELPTILHPEWRTGHPGRIFANNREVALALAGIPGLFRRVNHPALGPHRHLSWAESPFVVLEFHQHEDLQENHALLLRIIENESKARGVAFYLGVSFGFRHHRCEVVVSENSFPYPNGQMRGFFKVAVGSRRGPSFEGMLALLKELAACADFQALRRAYPQWVSESPPGPP